MYIGKPTYNSSNVPCQFFTSYRRYSRRSLLLSPCSLFLLFQPSISPIWSSMEPRWTISRLITDTLSYRDIREKCQMKPKLETNSSNNRCYGLMIATTMLRMLSSVEDPPLSTKKSQLRLVSNDKEGRQRRSSFECWCGLLTTRSPSPPSRFWFQILLIPISIYLYICCIG